MIEYILFIIGFIFLLKGADDLVEGSASIARKFRISKLVVGLTIVSFGTSLPELVVNITSSIKGDASIAIGTIIGSNLANILLILGISAIINPIKVHYSTIRREIPYSLVAAIILLLLSNGFFNGTESALSRIDGIILLVFFITFIYYIYDMAKKTRVPIEIEKAVEKKTIEHSNAKNALKIFSGLALLYFGGEWVVNGAVAIAKLSNISEYVISATIIAFGTSLPEFMTSIVAIKKREDDIFVGNIVGSNIFNIFFVLAISMIILPISIGKYAKIDMIILIFATLLLFGFLYLDKKQTLAKREGIFLILTYVAYVAYLILRQ